MQARADGLPISIETAPHYLTFAAEDVPDGATIFKCAPPIRGTANRDALIAAVTAGEIDLLASDHSPTVPALKELESGDFIKAWGGISGLQYMLPAAFTVAKVRALLRRGACAHADHATVSAAPGAPLVGLALHHTRD